MGGDEDGALGRAQPLNQVAKALRPYRIESVRRLVENQHLLIAKQRLGEPQALQIALGERLELLVAVLPDSERIDNRLDALARDGDRQAREHRETLEGPLERPLRIERDELRQIADAVQLDIRARGAVGDRDAARRGRQVAQQQRDERALPGPVRSGWS